MADRYGPYSSSASSPATRSTPVTPHDVNPVDPAPKAIFVGTAGNVVGQLLEDTVDRTFKLPAGYHPLRFKLIKATGTTAADMIGLD